MDAATKSESASIEIRRFELLRQCAELVGYVSPADRLWLSREIVARKLRKRFGPITLTSPDRLVELTVRADDEEVFVELGNSDWVLRGEDLASEFYAEAGLGPGAAVARFVDEIVRDEIALTHGSKGVRPACYPAAQNASESDMGGRYWSGRA